jgi:hypothetical protein
MGLSWYKRSRGRLLTTENNAMNISLVLGQTVTTMQTLETAVGHALGIIIILGYVYAVVLIVMACIQDKQDGSWKTALARAIGLFAASGICNILLAIFFPGQQIVPSFN